jgi:hypothetical protein
MIGCGKNNNLLYFLFEMYTVLIHLAASKIPKFRMHSNVDWRRRCVHSSTNFSTWAPGHIRAFPAGAHALVVASGLSLGATRREKRIDTLRCPRTTTGRAFYGE